MIWLVALTAETVEGSALSLQSIDDVHGSDGLALGMLGVSDGIADNVLEEDLEDTSRLFVDEARDTLDTTATSQSSDGWRISALVEGVDGMLIKVDKLSS